MVVFHKDPMGITVSICVYILLFYGDWAVVYHVIEYGKHANASERRTYGALLAHFLLLMAIISHIRASLSNPGYVPLPSTKIDFSSDLEKADPNQKKKKKREHTSMFEWSVCTKCETYRPPRSHHCRKCGRCVRRMDHHCPWINNCVGELNFKYFFLFLVYTGLLCLYAIILIVSDWVHHWSEDDENDSVDRVCTLILFFETVIFGMFVTAVACGSSIAVLCDRNAIELRRYGAPAWFPKTPKLILVQALCGRGSMFFWLLPCVRPRIPDPVPPSKLPSFNSVQNV